MSEPFPFDHSSSLPLPDLIAAAHLLPQSNTSPNGVYSPIFKPSSKSSYDVIHINSSACLYTCTCSKCHACVIRSSPLRLVMCTVTCHIRTFIYPFAPEFLWNSNFIVFDQAVDRGF